MRTCVSDMHALAEVEMLQVCEGHQLHQTVVCDGAGDEPMVAPQGQLLQHRKVPQVTQLGRAYVLQDKTPVIHRHFVAFQVCCAEQTVSAQPAQDET
jgi:hypothetical protein